MARVHIEALEQNQREKDCEWTSYMWTDEYGETYELWKATNHANYDYVAYRPNFCPNCGGKVVIQGGGDAFNA